jgi:hypothetical protein
MHAAPLVILLKCAWALWQENKLFRDQEGPTSKIEQEWELLQSYRTPEECERAQGRIADHLGQSYGPAECPL